MNTTEESVNQALIDKSTEPSVLKEKKFVYTTICVLSIIGLIVPFAAQFLLPLVCAGSNVAGVEVWNQYVSMILGIVATLMSIISLKMGFDNVERSYETESRTTDLLHRIEIHLVDVRFTQDKLLDNVSELNGLVGESYVIAAEPSIGSKSCKDIKNSPENQTI